MTIVLGDRLLTGPPVFGFEILLNIVFLWEYFTKSLIFKNFWF